MLSTTVFTDLPHFMEHNQTASMQMKTAILLTQTIGAYRARALAPTFSWGEPHNGGLSATLRTGKTLSYAFL